MMSFAWAAMPCLLVVGCGSVSQDPDAPSNPDARLADAPVDASAPDAACVDTPIFLGGMDPAPQGWTLTSSGTGTVTQFGPTITQIRTQTVGGSGAQRLLSRPGTVVPGAPFAIELSMQVQTVDPHNFLDGAAVLMGSYSGGFGNGVDRGQMIYIDAGQVGWADDTGMFAATSTDTFHNYRLAVDAGGNATVFRDGVQILSRAGFTTDGTIAFGDQTNDPNVEADILIRSITLLCSVDP